MPGHGRTQGGGDGGVILSRPGDRGKGRVERGLDDNDLGPEGCEGCRMVTLWSHLGSQVGGQALHQDGRWRGTSVRAGK